MLLSVGRLKFVELVITGEVLSEMVFDYTLGKFEKEW